MDHHEIGSREAVSERLDADYRDYQLMLDRTRLRKADESGDEDLYWSIWTRAVPEPPLPVLAKTAGGHTGEVSASSLQAGQAVILDSGLNTRRAVVIKHHITRWGHAVIVQTEDREFDSLCGLSTRLGIGWRLARRASAVSPHPPHA